MYTITTVQFQEISRTFLRTFEAGVLKDKIEELKTTKHRCVMRKTTASQNTKLEGVYLSVSEFINFKVLKSIS